MKSSTDRFKFRKLRTRSRVFGTAERPRLSVYRSLKHIHAQVIDDNQGMTLAAASSSQKNLSSERGIKAATLIGEALGKKAIEKGIKKIVFDCGGRQYHGRVKGVAEGARKAGLQF